MLKKCGKIEPSPDRAKTDRGIKMSNKIKIQWANDKAPVGMDYAAYVWIDGKAQGLYFGLTSGIEEASQELKAECLNDDIAWTIDNGQHVK